MHKVGFVALVTLALGAAANAGTAVIITQWDFNQFPASGALPNPAPSLGTGTAGGVNLSGATPLTGSASDLGGGNVSSDPTQPGTAWNSTGYAPQGTENNNRGVQFNVSTLGYTDAIGISFDVRGSNTASRYIRLMYSLDGTTFTSAGLDNDGVYEIVGGPVFNNGITFSLANIAGASNNANFAFRIVATFAPNTNAYAAVGSGSNYGTGGTLRYDMVTVFVPAPGAIALLGLAGFVARRRRD